MANPYNNARQVARIGISDVLDRPGVVLTRDIISDEVKRATLLHPLPNDQKEKLIKDLESVFNTWIGEDRSLDAVGDDHIDWLPAKRHDIHWHFWERYMELLKGNGWAEKTILKLDEMTDHTLMRLEDPSRPGIWDRRGLVVGHVQSGKTSNYIGLICKASDAGYRVIIVLAGMHNNLRSQTQTRLDEGFLGYDSATLAIGPGGVGAGGIRAIGVGRIDSHPRVDTITNRLDDGDFKRAVANNFSINPGGNPLLFVVKKNVSVLRNLLTWLEWAANGTTEDGRKIVMGVPLLLIDDECDFGSIDTRAEAIDEDGKPNPDHDPTRINEMIRRILMSFERRVIVGFSATPFANILIHDETRTPELGYDLFPRSFITCLPSPSNHVGPARMFGIAENDGNATDLDSLPLVRTNVEDHADSQDPAERDGWMPPKHNKFHDPIYNGDHTIPPSLREAIYCFVLASAARRARGQIQNDQHNSMLIHVTRFQDVQERVREEVNMEIVSMKRHMKRGSKGDGDKVLGALKDLWEQDFVPTTASVNKEDCPPLSWQEVSKHIGFIVSSLLPPKVINGSSADIVDYQSRSIEPINVIVIGGDKLSRGLTLEGLTTSYFLRPSKMYDTLMQMGRWFGYRPGYLDLCRVFTRKDICNWYYEITLADEELRREFDYMWMIKGTPKDYGLKVRQHPGLLVTSRVKMRNGTRCRIGFGGSVPGTLVLFRQPEQLLRNYRAFEWLVQRLKNAGNIPRYNFPVNRNNNKKYHYKGFLWSNVSSDVVLSFLDDYETHPDSYRTDKTLLRTYIAAMIQKGFLTNWTIYIPSGEGKEWKFPYAENKINMVKRGWRSTVGDDDRISSKKFMIKAIVSEGSHEEQVDLDDNQYSRALEETIKDHKNKFPDDSKSIPEDPNGIQTRYQRPPEKALLIVYPLDPTENIAPDWKEYVPAIGFAISFPGNKDDETVEYVVNNTYLSQERGHDVAGV